MDVYDYCVLGTLEFAFERLGTYDGHGVLKGGRRRTYIYIYIYIDIYIYIYVTGLAVCGLELGFLEFSTYGLRVVGFKHWVPFCVETGKHLVKDPCFKPQNRNDITWHNLAGKPIVVGSHSTQSIW